MALNWFKKLKSGLSKSASKVEGAIASITGKKTVDQETLDNIEEQLILADLGIEVAARITKKIKDQKFEIKDKKEINSKCKFETGTYKTTYTNCFDGMTEDIHLIINISKVTKCYVNVDVIADRRGRVFTGRLWIHKYEDNQMIEFSIYHIWSDELIPY